MRKRKKALAIANGEEVSETESSEEIT